MMDDRKGLCKKCKVKRDECTMTCGERKQNDKGEIIGCEVYDTMQVIKGMYIEEPPGEQ